MKTINQVTHLYVLLHFTLTMIMFCVQNLIVYLYCTSKSVPLSLFIDFRGQCTEKELSRPSFGKVLLNSSKFSYYVAAFVRLVLGFVEYLNPILLK